MQLRIVDKEEVAPVLKQDEKGGEAAEQVKENGRICPGEAGSYLVDGKSLDVSMVTGGTDTTPKVFRLTRICIAVRCITYLDSNSLTCDDE